jgi:hypothetical protein
LLAACSGGGGNDGIDPVSLSTKADVIREIGTFEAMQGEEGAQPASSARARRSGAQRLMSRSTSSQARGRHPKSYAPAAETVPCDSGSVSYEDFTGATRNYPLFGVTPPSTDYAVLQFRDCVDNSYYPWTYTTDGRSESGNSTSTAQTPAYSYEVLGSGSTPYTDAAEDKSTGDRYTTQLLGRIEDRDNGAVWQSREHLTASLRSTFDGDTFSMTVGIGEDGNPMVFTDDYGVGTLAIDGPMHYSSSFCEGGRIEVTTNESLTFGSDESGSFINGGQLVIEAGSRSVTITFQGDGGASYEFNDGDSGTITRDEISGGSECLPAF